MQSLVKYTEGERQEAIMLLFQYSSDRPGKPPSFKKVESLTGVPTSTLKDWWDDKGAQELKNANTHLDKRTDDLFQNCMRRTAILFHMTLGQWIEQGVEQHNARDVAIFVDTLMKLGNLLRGEPTERREQWTKSAHMYYGPTPEKEGQKKTLDMPDASMFEED